MEQAPKTDITRKINLPFPQILICCVTCGKPLTEVKGSFKDDFRVTGIPGCIVMSCEEHLDYAKVVSESIHTAIMKKLAENINPSQEDTKTE